MSRKLMSKGGFHSEEEMFPASSRSMLGKKWLRSHKRTASSSGHSTQPVVSHASAQGGTDPHSASSRDLWGALSDPALNLDDGLNVLFQTDSSSVQESCIEPPVSTRTEESVPRSPSPLSSSQIEPRTPVEGISSARRFPPAPISPIIVVRPLEGTVPLEPQHQLSSSSVPLAPSVLTTSVATISAASSEGSAIVSTVVSLQASGTSSAPGTVVPTAPSYSTAVSYPSGSVAPSQSQLTGHPANSRPQLDSNAQSASLDSIMKNFKDMQNQISLLWATRQKGRAEENLGVIQTVSPQGPSVQQVTARDRSRSPVRVAQHQRGSTPGARAGGNSPASSCSNGDSSFGLSDISSAFSDTDSDGRDAPVSQAEQRVSQNNSVASSSSFSPRPILRGSQREMPIPLDNPSTSGRKTRFSSPVSQVSLFSPDEKSDGDLSSEDESEDVLIPAGFKAPRDSESRFSGLVPLFDTEVAIWERVLSGEYSLFVAPNKAELFQEGIVLDESLVASTSDCFIGRWKGTLVAAFPFPSRAHWQLMASWNPLVAKKEGKKPKFSSLLRCGAKLVSKKAGFDWVEDPSPSLVLPSSSVKELDELLITRQGGDQRKKLQAGPKFPEVELRVLDKEVSLLSFLQAKPLDGNAHKLDSYGQTYTMPVPEPSRKKDKLTREHALELIRSKASVDLACALVGNIAEGKNLKKMQAQAVVAQGLLEFTAEKINADASSSLLRAVSTRKACREDAIKNIHSREVVVLDNLRNGKISEGLFSDSSKDVFEKAMFCQAPRPIAQNPTHVPSRQKGDTVQDKSRSNFRPGKKGGSKKASKFHPYTQGSGNRTRPASYQSKYKRINYNSTHSPKFRPRGEKGFRSEQAGGSGLKALPSFPGQGIQGSPRTPPRKRGSPNFRNHSPYASRNGEKRFDQRYGSSSPHLQRGQQSPKRSPRGGASRGYTPKRRYQDRA